MVELGIDRFHVALKERDQLVERGFQVIVVLDLHDARQSGHQQAAFGGRIIDAPNVAQRLEQVVLQIDANFLTDLIDGLRDIRMGRRIDLFKLCQ